MRFPATVLSRLALLGAFIATSLVPGQIPGQGSCSTLSFINDGMVPATGLHFRVTQPGAVIENVVLPPSASGAYRPCDPATPRYLITCAPIGTTVQVDITFGSSILPGQWVAVTIRSPFPVTVVAFPSWDLEQGQPRPALYEATPSVYLNELSAGSDDWVEIINTSPMNAVDLDGYRVEFRNRNASTNTQRFQIDSTVMPTVLPPLGRAIIHDGLASVGGAALDYDVTVLSSRFTGNGSGGINWSCSSEGSVYLVRPGVVWNLVPVDAMVFGYFLSANSSVLEPNYPAPDTLQIFCENPGGSLNQHHSAYRMRACLRFDPDAWNNRQLPEAIMGTGPSGALVSPVTPGDPNPGQCLAGGPPAIVLRVSRCPSILTIEGAEPGTTVYWVASTTLQPTQNSGAFIGLNLSPLLLSSLQLALTPGSPFQGAASLPSVCGGSAASFEIPLGVLPPLCFELAAFGMAPTPSGPTLALSNVVRLH